MVVRVDGSRPMLRLEICNAGAVPEHVLPFLFQPLQGGEANEDYRSRPGKGFGLGLFISREIAVAHGGTIDVTSSESDGTARDRHAAAPLITRSAAAMSGSQAPTSTRRGPSFRPSSEPIVSS